MSAGGQHCPFVNKPDGRCAEHLSLDHLRHSFAYCFGQYQSCPVYDERLEERQGRRCAGMSPAAAPLLSLTIHATSSTTRSPARRPERILALAG